MSLGKRKTRENTKLLPLREWKEAAGRGQVEACTFNPVLNAVRKDAGEDGPISFIASTPSQDRYGDVILAEGWDLTRYKQNPVFLFAHNWWDLPIGKAPGVGVASGVLLTGPVDFAGEDVNPMGPQCEAAVRQGYMSAVSVGFNPLEWSFTDDGVLFKACELLEISLVPIPANADALVQSKGGAEHWLKSWTAKVALDERLPPATRALAHDLDLIFRGSASTGDDEGKRLVAALERVAEGLTALLAQGTENSKQLDALVRFTQKFEQKTEAEGFGGELSKAIRKFLK